MTIETHKAVARRLYEEVFSVGNLAAADEILAEDCISHGPGSPPAVGRDGIKRQASVLRGAIPDLRVILEDQVGEGDLVASRWTGSGINSGTFQMPGVSIPPTNRPISFGELRVDRFEGDLIAESWFIPDRFSLWQQLGLIELPSATPAAAQPR